MTKEIIRVEDLRYRYPTGTGFVLGGMDFALRKGEFVGMVGATGAGKTTFCQALNGLIPHYTGGVMEGRVVVHGQDTRQLSVADLSEHVGMVFQDADAQLVMSTVEEECLLGPLSHGLTRAEARRRARDVLERMGVAHLAQRAPQTLSGGQKQRVAIAAVMVTEPEVLVLDEATSELDALMVHKIFEICRHLNQEFGTTILIVTHEMELLAQHAGRLVLVDQGQVLLDAPTREALEQHDVFRQVGVRLPQVTELALRLREPVQWKSLPLTEDEAVEGLNHALPERGPTMNETEDQYAADDGEPAIRVEGVRFAYNEPVTVLDDLDLEFMSGEFSAIIGNNGSGKSTLMKLILGLLEPSSGRVVVDGVDTKTAKVSTMARKIGFIFQDPNDQLFTNSVAEEVEFGLENLGLDEDQIRRRVEATLEQFGLSEMRDVFPRFLARGDKQKLCIASIVAMRPKMLLLDEPTTGQDHRDSQQIMELARSLNEQGITVLLVTHDLNNVARYARRIVVVNDGRIVATGPTHEIMSDVELLNSCHLTPPQIVRTGLRLQGRGVVPEMTPEGLAQRISMLLSSSSLGEGAGDVA